MNMVMNLGDSIFDKYGYILSWGRMRIAENT
jgi:hypothetical protein